MKRKEFLKKSLLATIAGTSILNACASDVATEIDDGISINYNKIHRWKMVTTWPPNFPVLGEAANKFAEMVEKMSGGRLVIKVFGGGQLVPPLEAFDTVASGTVEMGCGAAYYWTGKSPATQFFAAVPFGMNAQMLNSWLVAGGGYDLWKEVYAQFNLIPLMGGNSGVQMGGWFNREINTIADFKGLKMRIPGLGGKVIEKAGGAAVLVAGSELYTSMERGVIDALEWIGPYHDYKMGFPKIAKYYYSPGWHEPGTELEFFMNNKAYEKLSYDLKEIVQSASQRIQNWMLAEFDYQNAIFYKKILDEGKVQVKKFPKPVLDALKVYTTQSLEEVIGEDPLSKKVYEHYQDFLKKASVYNKLTEEAYYNLIAQ